MVILDRPALFTVDRAGLVARLRLTAIAAGYFLAAFPSLLLLVLTVVSLALTPIVLGALFLLVVVPVLAAFAAVRRRAAGALLGRDLTATHPPTRPDPAHKLLGWARSETRWRDFAALAFSCTGGWAIDLVVLCAFVGPFSLLIQPLLLLGHSGLFLLLWLGVPLTAAVWWIVTPILVPIRVSVEAAILTGSRERELEQEVERVAAARTESIDHSAAELRRIERDLHDGPQARMVSLGMNLGIVEELMRTDPDAAVAALDEARASTLSALEDLRSLVRGIHPPVLADRGLAGAVQALALDVSLPVLVRGELPGRPPAPVESAMYFAIAECLANVVKHADARQAWIDLSHTGHELRVLVRDDGVGGADVSRGTGLAGLTRRLGVFDGSVVVDSPTGGPTTVTLTIPCDAPTPAD